MRGAALVTIGTMLAASAAAAQPAKKPKRHHRGHAKPAERAHHDDVVAIEIDPPPPATEPAADPEPDVIVARETVSRTPAAKPRNRFYVRAGVAYVDPRMSSGSLQLQPTALASLAATMPPQGGIETDASSIFAGIIGFAPAALGGRVAFETIVGAPATMQLHATGGLATQSLAPTALGVPTGIPPLGRDIGQASAVPPTVTVVYMLPDLGPVTPYVGAGASVLFVTDAKITNPVLTAVATPKLDISPVAGVVAQAGLDVHVGGSFYARLDVKELWYQPADTTISNIQVHTTIPLLEVVDVGSAKSVVTANPIIVQAGLGFDF